LIGLVGGGQSRLGVDFNEGVESWILFGYPVEVGLDRLTARHLASADHPAELGPATFV
jgi:hypothetical protein